MVMIKGRDTKNTIIETGLEMASQLGLECVTIGNLSKEMQMSKSGLFAHFQSKENLQIDILNYAAEDFRQYVILPALKVERGIPRIRNLVDRWIEWGDKLTGGCIFVSAGMEYSDRPGKVRETLLKQQEEWIDSLRRIAQSAIKAGDFGPDIDCEQFAFDLYSLLLGFHYYYKMLNDNKTKQKQQVAFERLLDNYRVALQKRMRKTSPKS
jgi:AcrR family transcriptional regulator